MIDHHTHRDHRYEAARETCDRYSVERSWCIVPERPPVPGSVKVVMAVIVLAGVLATVAPSIARMVIA